MQPTDIKSMDRKIIRQLASDVDRRAEANDDDNFSRYAKSRDYRLYGKDNFIKDAPKE